MKCKSRLSKIWMSLKRSVLFRNFSVVLSRKSSGFLWSGRRKHTCNHYNIWRQVWKESKVWFHCLVLIFSLTFWSVWFVLKSETMCTFSAGIYTSISCHDPDGLSSQHSRKTRSYYFLLSPVAISLFQSWFEFLPVAELTECCIHS